MSGKKAPHPSSSSQAPSSATSLAASTERRTRRSTDPLVALHYQLAAARARGELDAIVVADTSGVVVAGAGSWPTCEEIAAFAPLLADGAWASMSDAVSSRVEWLRREVEVRTVSIGEQDVLLCARKLARNDEGDPGASNEDARSVGNSAENLEHAAAGIARILRAAA